MGLGSVVLCTIGGCLVRHTLPINSRFTKLTYNIIIYFHSLDMPNAEHRHSFYFALYSLRQWSLPLSRDAQSLQLLGLPFSLSIIICCPVIAHQVTVIPAWPCPSSQLAFLRQSTGIPIVCIRHWHWHSYS